MAKTITIIGAGMMGSALAFPARENGNSVRLVGTPLDREIIEACKAEGKHPKFEKAFPQGIEYFQFDNWKEAEGLRLHNRRRELVRCRLVSQ